MDIAVGYFYLPAFAQVADLLAARAPANSASSPGAPTAPPLAQIAAGLPGGDTLGCSPTAALPDVAVLTPV